MKYTMLYVIIRMPYILSACLRSDLILVTKVEILVIAVPKRLTIFTKNLILVTGKIIACKDDMPYESRSKGNAIYVMWFEQDLLISKNKLIKQEQLIQVREKAD